MTDNEYKERVNVAEWLNSKGYDIEIDRDGFWMEEIRFTEHKTKDVVGLVLDYSESLREENYRLRAAVAEMARMLPVLERLDESYPTLLKEACGNAVELPSVLDYRQTLEIALAKRNEP